MFFFHWKVYFSFWFLNFIQNSIILYYLINFLMFPDCYQSIISYIFLCLDYCLLSLDLLIN